MPSSLAFGAHEPLRGDLRTLKNFLADYLSDTDSDSRGGEGIESDSEPQESRSVCVFAELMLAYD